MAGCSTKKSKCNTGLTDEQKKILEVLDSVGGPMASKEIAKETGLTSNQVSCRIRSLKNKGYVESPERCKYQVTEEGRSALQA